MLTAILLASAPSLAPAADAPAAVTSAPPATAEAPAPRRVGSLIFPDRHAEKRESSALKLLTPEVLDMTRKAMDFVRSSQQSDGGWGDKQYPKSSGVSALCCMALLAEGSLPRVGYSGKCMDKGIGFLLGCAGEDGLIVAKDSMSEYGPMYDHTWATFVLLQAYGNCPWYSDMRAKISRAVQAMMKAQKPDGGWRFAVSPTGHSDVPVTSSVLTTIRLAKMSGFAVPDEAIAKAQEFILRCGKPVRPEDEGTFCYREGGERGSASTSAAALLALFSRGMYDHPYVKPCTEKIVYRYQRAHPEDFKDPAQYRQYHMGCYYVSQALYMSGDESWIPWYRKFAGVIKQTQNENGSVQESEGGNTVYPTAVTALVLQAPLGYMPQYLR